MQRISASQDTLDSTHQIDRQWPPGTVVIQIATYNEAASIDQLLQSIHTNLPHAQILVIDDNSPDGTAEIVTQQADKHNYIHLLLRVDRRGLGTATLEGLIFAYQRGASIAIHLDGDLSHDAADLPRLLEALTPADEEPFDIAIGSRKIPGGNTVGWSVKRHVISWFVCWFTRVILRVPVRDASSGFRALRLHYISTMNLDNIACGYAFFEDFLWRAHRTGARITEIPITFTDRKLGKSKATGIEMLRGARDLLKIAVQTWVK
ncbi:MAG: polyprenol monophosphomannose synthase [Planctomycetaceae bacterium]|nr:polyprenol monophosphomannose synthase [Planctomycetaceae bacterium]